MTAASWVALLTEPVALIGWVLLGLAWHVHRACEQKSLRWATLIVAGIYFWFASPLGANLMVGALEHRTYPEDACRSPGARPVIVALAGGTSGTASSPQEFFRLQQAGFRRVVEAVRFAGERPGSVLLFSGGTGGSVREADMMQALARALGFPPARILLERESENTYESALAVKHIVQERHFTLVYLVTSALHMPRANGAFVRAGIRTCPRPVDYRWLRPAPNEALVPQISALAKSTDALHEFAGYFWYWIRGWL